MSSLGNYRFIKFFEDVRTSDIDLVGGKNASLGELLSFAIPVPLGFAVSASAFDYILENNYYTIKNEEITLKEYIRRQIGSIKKELQSEDILAIQRVDQICASIRTAIEQSQIPDSMQDEILDAYHKLLEKIGEDTSFAIRSSATAEDLPESSFAGQQDTHLNISGEENILRYILKDMASIFTTRATAYRERSGYDHFDVKLAVGVQEMAGGLGGVKSSGVMFTEDPDSGNENVIVIRGVWGLGELIVQGAEEGDENIIFKHNPKGLTIIASDLVTKKNQLVFDTDIGGTKTIPVPVELQNHFCLTGEQAIELAKYGMKIREHYGKRMDIEWAIGNNDKIYIVQARPETVHSIKGDKEEIFYLIDNPQDLKKNNKLISSNGTAIGRKIAIGRLKIIEDINYAHLLEEGDILVTLETNPDWTSYMQNLNGVITERGGPTCHAAIVSRELELASIVGADNIVQILKEYARKGNISITIDCSEGEARIWGGEVEFDYDTIEFNNLPRTKTKILVNLGIPKGALSSGKYPDGTGLARLEFIINDLIQIHPNALLHFDDLIIYMHELLEKKEQIESLKKSDLTKKDPFLQKIENLKNTLEKIAELTAGYDNKEEYYVQKLAEGIATIAAGVWKTLPDGSIAEAVVRLSDFKTNEYKNLIGGWLYEHDENNPMLGFRGGSRYVSEDFEEAFRLELRAIKRARSWGLTNIIPMVPFCRTPDEAEAIIKLMQVEGLVRGQDGLKVYVMAEIPSNIFLADIFCNYFDGFSIGSNDLTQLIYGCGRDNQKLLPLAEKYNYNANSEAIKRAIEHLIKVAHERFKKVGICGQAPSDYPEFLKFLIQQKIDSISLNPDTYARGRIFTWRTEVIEDLLKEGEKVLAYNLLIHCDKMIEDLRIPRGKLRNYIQKKRKKIDSTIIEKSRQINHLFGELSELSVNFVNLIKNKKYDDFTDLRDSYKQKIVDYSKEIPKILKNINKIE